MSTLEIEAIKGYLISVGCKIEYPILVNAFKKHLYNPDPNIQGKVRTQFKDYVNRLATVSLENNMKFIILRPEFRPANQVMPQYGQKQQQQQKPPLPPPLQHSLASSTNQANGNQQQSADLTHGGGRLRQPVPSPAPIQQSTRHQQVLQSQQYRNDQPDSPRFPLSSVPPNQQLQQPPLPPPPPVPQHQHYNQQQPYHNQSMNNQMRTNSRIMTTMHSEVAPQQLASSTMSPGAQYHLRSQSQPLPRQSSQSYNHHEQQQQPQQQQYHKVPQSPLFVHNNEIKHSHESISDNSAFLMPPPPPPTLSQQQFCSPQRALRDQSSNPRIDTPIVTRTKPSTNADQQMPPPRPPPRRRQSTASLFKPSPAKLIEKISRDSYDLARKSITGRVKEHAHRFNSASTNDLNALMPKRNGSMKENRLSRESLFSGLQRNGSQLTTRSRSSHRGEDESDSSSLQPIDPLRRRWAIEACNCNYNNLVSLLNEDPKLASCKDIVNGYTALHWAAKFGNLDIIKLIAGSYGVSANTKSSAGYSPLHVAYMFNRLEAANLLLQSYQASVDIRDHSGKKPKQYWQNS